MASLSALNTTSRTKEISPVARNNNRATTVKDELRFPGVDFSVSLDEYLSRHELLFRQAVSDWHCGLPLGNGDLTATSFEPDCLAWNVGKVDLWDLRFDREKFPLVPHDRVRKWAESRDQKALEAADIFEAQAQSQGKILDPLPGEAELPKFSSPPQPKRAGELRLFLSDSTSLADFVEKRLSLYRADARVILGDRDHRSAVESYVHATRDVLAIHVDLSGERDPHALELSRPIDPHTDVKITVVNAAPFFGLDTRLPDGTRYVLLLAVSTEPGECEARPDGLALVLDASSSFSIYATVALSDGRTRAGDPLEVAKERLQSCLDADRAVLKASHESWWHDFWSRSFVSVSDKMLEHLWYHHLYILGASSRSTVPPPILGPWYCDDYQPWHGDYHGNVNSQMTYWPIYASNHIELGEPYFSFLHNQLPRAVADARDVYGLRGAKYPTATYPGGKELSSLWFRYEMHTNAWNAEVFWWHWLYTHDREFLANVGYDVIREVTIFFLDYLEEERDGRLSVVPTMSPEQGDWMIKNPTIDLALIRELFTALLETSTVLDRDTELRQTCRNALERLSDYPHDGDVLLDYEGASPDLPLCHPALLAPVFPAGEVSPESEDRSLYERATRTLEGLLDRTARRIPDFPIDMPTWNDDMTWPWLACIAARMRRPDLCLAFLYDLGLLVHLKPNGFFTVVDFAPGLSAEYKNLDPASLEPMLNSGPGLVAAVNEMLLQSFDGLIRIFPAVPGDWDARFAQLRAVGGFLVSSEREGGDVRYFVVESLEGERCRVLSPWPEEEVTVTNLSTDHGETLAPAQEIGFSTEPGLTYRVEPTIRRSSGEKRSLSAAQRVQPRYYDGPLYTGCQDEQGKHRVTLGL